MSNFPLKYFLTSGMKLCLEIRKGLTRHVVLHVQQNAKKINFSCCE